jgi:hypothetical protein
LYEMEHAAFLVMRYLRVKLTTNKTTSSNDTFHNFNLKLHRPSNTVIVIALSVLLCSFPVAIARVLDFLESNLGTYWLRYACISQPERDCEFSGCAPI